MDVENLLCYKFYIIPDYSPTESKIILNADYTIGDSVSGFTMIALMQPSEDFSGLRKVSPPSILVKTLSTLVAPFTIPYIFYKYSGFVYKESCIKNAKFVSKERYLRILEDVPLEDIKKVYRHYGTTFNVVV
jgi:hypothetical protein